MVRESQLQSVSYASLLFISGTPYSFVVGMTLIILLNRSSVSGKVQKMVRERGRESTGGQSIVKETNEGKHSLFRDSSLKNF